MHGGGYHSQISSILIFCTEFYQNFIPMHRIYSNVYNIHAVYVQHEVLSIIIILGSVFG